MFLPTRFVLCIWKFWKVAVCFSGKEASPPSTIGREAWESVRVNYHDQVFIIAHSLPYSLSWPHFRQASLLPQVPELWLVPSPEQALKCRTCLCCSLSWESSCPPPDVFPVNPQRSHPRACPLRLFCWIWKLLHIFFPLSCRDTQPSLACFWNQHVLSIEIVFLNKASPYLRLDLFLFGS